MVRIEVRVVPKSKEQGLYIKDGLVKVALTSPPEKGKANEELVKFFKELGLDAHIVKGLSSRRKTLEIRGEKDEIWKKIEHARKR
ncbi:MAG: YggU family protein [Methanobacteriota archaeon]|nr:MAG: YggU family protein [Euryarchaeota archaeon]